MPLEKPYFPFPEEKEKTMWRAFWGAFFEWYFSLSTPNLKYKHFLSVEQQSKEIYVCDI